MSAFPPKADIRECVGHVRFVPKAAIPPLCLITLSSRALATVSPPQFQRPIQLAIGHAFDA
jgi:hypothetical protein